MTASKGGNLDALRGGGGGGGPVASDSYKAAQTQSAITQTVVNYVNRNASRSESEKDAAGKLEANQTAAFRNVQKATAKTAVLDSFKVEQNGNGLRVTDHDGSTYDGDLVVTAAQTAAGTTPDFADKSFGKAAAGQEATGGKLFQRAAQNAPGQQNYYFNVAGTNRTLNQRVVFIGNFIATTNAVQTQMPAQAVQQLQNFPLFFNNSTIIGRAQVDREPEIDVNAVPVTQ
jgi:hypothetical protein